MGADDSSEPETPRVRHLDDLALCVVTGRGTRVATAAAPRWARNGRRQMPGLDTGNTGFMLLCSSLVMLMTPGLAFFYGGLVGRRNVLAIMIQSFVSMGWTTVLWWAFGFSMCFSGDLKTHTDFAGIVGNFHWAFLHGITL